ncbi:MAG TPA: PilZ domain-containing protein [Solirubrobacteraceae bacterium]|nr:PilZ domain-containing protein [Solirubrobacteraceae bacterium]
MKLGRGKPRSTAPLALPERSTNVTVRTPEGGSIPAVVIEQSPDEVLVAITVPTKPLTERQLEGLVLEYHNDRGRVRLQGTFSVDPTDTDVMCMAEPRSVEVLQERSYVRIQAARPVVVYGTPASGDVQSFTVDLSGGGFLLAGGDRLPIGQEVRFRLSITSDALPVTGTGRVVRVDSLGRRGVEFESISDLDRRRLVRFIFECQRAERKRGL